MADDAEGESKRRLPRRDEDHLGSRSTLAPPEGEKRRTARRDGVVGFKRAGWAEKDEAVPQKKAKPARGRGGGRGRGGRGAGRAAHLHDPARADDAQFDDLALLREGVGGKRAGAAGAGEATLDGRPAGAGKKAPARKKPKGAGGSGDGGASGRALQPTGGKAGGGGEAGNGGGEAEGCEEADAEGGGEGAAGDRGARGSYGKRKARVKQMDEGDWPELKPRHLRGKRKEEMLLRQAANKAAAAARVVAATSGGGGGAGTSAAADEDEEASVLKLTLCRLLRPKLRRWAMYEWFYSPVDVAWYRESPFCAALGACGLGQVSVLPRAEWSYVRSLLGKPRRFSPAYVEQERAALREHREGVREARRRAARPAGLLDEATTYDPRAAAQLAVGQRVTALHPRLRQLHSGTVLSPDGDHYKVQFDSPKLGVHLVEDVLVAPLLDGTRGIDFTSPRSLTPGISPDEEPVASGTGKTAVASANEQAKAAPKELQLLAYILRLLQRKRMLIGEQRAVCGDCEEYLLRVGREVHEEHKGARGDVDALLVEPGTAGPKVEVTAAQQRQLGQVPPPPLLPPVHAMLSLLAEHSEAEHSALRSEVRRWSLEISWLQDELRGTSRRLEEALAAMRPMSQRFSLALGASAPEPVTAGVGVLACADLREEAVRATSAILSHEIASSTAADAAADAAAAAAADADAASDDAPLLPPLPSPPPPAVRETVSAALMLLLQLQAWARAPASSVNDCSSSISGSLRDLIPAVGSDANLKAFNAVANAAQSLEHILASGAS